jgi:MULE transposase-like protein
MGDYFDQANQLLSRRHPNKQDGTEEDIVLRDENILRDIERESNLSTSNYSDSDSHSSSNNLNTSSRRATHWDLPPPPAESFPTYELAKSSAHEWARLHGYDFSVKKARKNKDGKIHRRVLACTRGGKLDNKRKLTEETRIRKTRGSKKGGCEVQIWLAADDINEPEGPWSIRHARGTRSTWHNHPGMSEKDLPGHCQRTQKKGKVDDFIRQHRAARIKPQQSLAIIQQQMPDLPIVLNDVRNARSRQRREFIDTHTPAEAAILLLDEHGFYRDFVVGEDSRIKRLSLTRNQGNSSSGGLMCLLDCTYKSNKYNLPILNIVASSCLNKTLQVGLCFLSGESEEDYSWAIEAIKRFLTANDIPLDLYSHECSCHHCLRTITNLVDVHSLLPRQDSGKASRHLHLYDSLRPGTSDRRKSAKHRDICGSDSVSFSLHHHFLRPADTRVFRFAAVQAVFISNCGNNGVC